MVLSLDWRRVFPSEALSSDTVGLMLRVDCGRWGQTLDDLRRVALNAPHARTRERALALYDMAQGSCATQVAARTGRHPQTVMGWLHAYHMRGPAALAYGRTGGRPPFVPGPPPVSARSCARPRVRRPRRP